MIYPTTRSGLVEASMVNVSGFIPLSGQDIPKGTIYCRNCICLLFLHPHGLLSGNGHGEVTPALYILHTLIYQSMLYQMCPMCSSILLGLVNNVMVIALIQHLCVSFCFNNLLFMQALHKHA